MSAKNAERNLLIGMIALQMELITQEQLLLAFQNWTLARDQAIEDLLLKQGAINADGREFIGGMAAKFISLHQDSLELSIASLSSVESLREKLAALGDADIERTIQIVDEKRKSLDVQKEINPALDLTLAQEAKMEGRRFRILRPHAKGGLGEVSIAEDLELNREVALKQMQPRFRMDPESRSRFMIEAEITGRLEHPGIVPVYSLGTTEQGKPFYAMRFIRGHSLRQAITELYQSEESKSNVRVFRSALRKLLRRFVDVCNAIEYAHSRGVLHRDLKPGNVMLGKYGETLVVDWGLAKPIGKTEEYKQFAEEPTVIPKSKEGSSQTRMGTVVGTLAYMSPEQARGQHHLLGPKSDVYCLGATLYSILTGQPPIARGDETEMLEAIRSGKIRPPQEVNPFAPPAIAAICMKALALHPNDRYASAAQLAEDIEQWLADEAVSAYREPIHERIGRFIRHHQAAVASVIAALVVGTGILLIMNRVVVQRNEALRIARDAEAEQRAAAVEAEERAKINRDVAVQLSEVVHDSAESILKSFPSIESLRDRNELMDRSYQVSSKLDLAAIDLPELNQQFAKVARFTGNQMGRITNYDEAIRRLRHSIQIQEKLADAQTPNLKEHLGETYRDLGGWLKHVGKYSEAEEAYQKSSKLISELLAIEPKSLPFRRSQATLQLYAASLLMEQLRLDQARTDVTAASDFFSGLADDERSLWSDRTSAVVCYHLRARLLFTMDLGEEAVQWCDTVLPKVRAWCEANRSDPGMANNLVKLMLFELQAKLRLKVFDDVALKMANEAILIAEPFKTGINSSNAQTRADAYRVRGLLHSMRKDNEMAASDLAEAKKEAVRLQLLVNNADFDESCGKVLRDRAIMLLAWGKTEESSNEFIEAISAYESACRRAPESKRLARELVAVKTLAEKK